MARSILDIVIKLTKEGGADKETVKGLVQVKSAMMDAVAVAGTFVAAGYAMNKAYQATGGVFLDLAGKVRDTARATGLSTEESSKLIQVTDDLGVSYETLAKSIKTSADTTDFSIAGLAKASEEYLKIEDANKRAAYAQKLYGKAWVDMVAVLEKGPDAIRKNSDAINSSLILSQEQLDLAERNRIALDNLSDAGTAYAVAIGARVVPAATQLVEGLTLANDLFTKQHELMKSGEQTYSRSALYMAAIDMAQTNAAHSADSATVSYTAWAQALSQVAPAANIAAEATKEMGAANKEFLSTMGSMQSAEESYQNKSKELTQQRMDLEAEKQALLAQGYGVESTQIQEVNGKLEENNAAVQANANEYDLANKKIMLGYLERKLTADGILDDKELTWLLQKGVAWGVYSQTVVDSTRRAVDEANAMLESIPKEGTFALHLQTTGNYSDAALVTGGVRRAGGTAGWETVPSGYPNDSFPVWMTTGETYAVIPAGGSGGNVSVANGAAPSGGGGGGTVNVMVTINTQVNTADKEKLKAIMEPITRDAIRSAQAQGVL